MSDYNNSHSNSRYDVLFEPVQIGPVTSRNRFYQVPHCNSLGYVFPKSEATMRGIKAEGGWGVVSTQEVDIHPSTDVSPYLEGRLWDEKDMHRLALTVDAIHEHDSLAAIEITHNGHEATNRHSRLPLMAVSEMIPATNLDPVQAYKMTREDIANFRRWHRRAAIRSRDIGFDIVYVYAAHSLSLLAHFLSRKFNNRTDEYGGSLENRTRLLREVLDDTRDAVGDRCGIALRLAVREFMGQDSLSEDEGRDVVEMLADLPDIWDVNISGWMYDSRSSRFASEGDQESYIAFVKQITGKPVVGVGRFTSPDTMVDQVRRGVLDMIGAARPSIADPFLPEKIRQGRLEDIRECIGCNICVSGDMTVSPIRCTQNPTMGEEYRKNWHPEQIAPKSSEDSILVIGAGPAGLEAAMSLGKRGYRVVLAEASRHAGGRVARESLLPGLSEWRRVVDYRLGQIQRMRNVEVYFESRLDKQQVLELADELKCWHILCATGSTWHAGGIGRTHRTPIEIDSSVIRLTPDQIMDGQNVSGSVLIFDDDHYYMGGVIAEKLASSGCEVTLVTPEANVSAWTQNTLEQTFIEKRLHDLDVRLIEKHALVSLSEQEAIIQHVVSQEQRSLLTHNLILVTARQPDHQLYFGLNDDPDAMQQRDVRSVTRIGDCLAPSTIAAAVYAGHLYARDFDEKIDIDQAPYKREHTEI
ncbi:MAG: FAD-dependent oxidoreductase [Gammaproteobacteria bacterium]|nr:FAD-dependent oxidoreductase [Gammaproteobacteria bacterium]